MLFVKGDTRQNLLSGDFGRHDTRRRFGFAHNAVEHLWTSWKSAHGRLYLSNGSKGSYIFARTLKPYRNLKVKNSLVCCYVTEYATCSLVFRVSVYFTGFSDVHFVTSMKVAFKNKIKADLVMVTKCTTRGDEKCVRTVSRKTSWKHKLRWEGYTMHRCV